MKASLQITIADLEMIIVYAKAKKQNDSAASNTLVFNLIEETDTHLGSDAIKVEQKSAYSECNNIDLAATVIQNK